MKCPTPYFFKEGNATIWLTAKQYNNLKALMIQSIQDGKNPASRLNSFGPPPILDN
jgi:hypothetical protein